MSEVLEAEGLGRRYGRRRALRHCTLAIPAGRVVGLVGPNGAGKRVGFVAQDAPVSLEDLVLAYMSQSASSACCRR